MITVLYVCHYEKMNGAGMSLLDLLDHLDDKIIKAIVLLPKYGELCNALQERKIDYIIMPFQYNATRNRGQLNDKNAKTSYIDNYTCAMKIAELVKKQKINIIHSNTTVVNVGALAALITGVSHVWHIREFGDLDFGFHFYDEDIQLLLFKKTNKFISISKAVQRYWLEKYDIQSEQLYNGMNMNILTNSKIVCKDEHIYKIIIAGDITKNKGQLDAIKAIQHLIQMGFDKCRLTIIGNGTTRRVSYLKKYIFRHGLKKYVEILPYSNSLYEIRKGYDISLTCSKVEGMGRVTIEAMLAGNIVIGTNAGGTAELIGNEERGLLYTYGDYEQLADKIRYAVDNLYYVREKYQNCAKEYAKRICNPNRYADDIVAIYGKAMEDGKDIDYAETQGRLKDYYLKACECLKDIQKEELKSKTTVGNGANVVDQRYICMEHWLQLKSAGISLDDYFIQRDIRTIAIRGGGLLGEDLYWELEGSEVEVKYFIDESSDALETFVNVISPEVFDYGVDAVVITVFKDAQELFGEYNEMNKIKVYILKDVIEEIFTDNLCCCV